MLILSKKAYLKLKYFVKNTPGEISGMGRVVVENNSFVVKDLDIFEQECSGAFTELKEKAMAKFLYEKTKANEDVSEYHLWWHSHNDFGVFWSGTDEKTIETTTSNSFLVSIVANKKGEMLSRLDIFDPLKFHINLRSFIPKKVKENESIKRYCLKRIKDCVKEPAPFYPKYPLAKFPPVKGYTIEDLRDFEEEAAEYLPESHPAQGQFNYGGYEQETDRGWKKIPSMQDIDEELETLGIVSPFRIKGRIKRLY